MIDENSVYGIQTVSMCTVQIYVMYSNIILCIVQVEWDKIGKAKFQWKKNGQAECTPSLCICYVSVYHIRCISVSCVTMYPRIRT